jgi:hypothetical protein
MRYKITSLKLFQTKCTKTYHTVAKKSLLFICAALLFTAPNQALSDDLTVIGGNANLTADGAENSYNADGSYENAEVRGGIGGNGGNADNTANGGKGGDASVNISSLRVYGADFVGGNGGNGGSGSAGVAGANAVDDSNGAAGYPAGDNGAIGGDGGSVSANADSIVADDTTVIGGNGGNGGNGAAGGKGGNGAAVGGAGGAGANGGVGSTGGNGASVDINVNSITSSTFVVTGGNGGNGANGANSGKGGDGGNTSSYGTGKGGDGGTGGAGGNGGKGGDVTINALSVNVDTLSITTGNNGGAGTNGGAGGNGLSGGAGGNYGVGGTTAGLKGSGGIAGSIYFSADTLKASNIYINKRDGALGFHVGTLYVQENTLLNVVGTAANDISISSLYFDISNIADGSTMLNVTGSGQIDFSNSYIFLSSIGGSAPLGVGYTITLINDTTGSHLGGVYLDDSTTAKHGAIFLYDFNIETVGDSVIATLQGVRHNPDTKAFSEGHLSGITFINSADELLSDENLKNSVFAVTSYGLSKYKTGSSVDTKGFSLLTGVSKNIKDSGYAGLYFEGGSGSYDIKGESDASGDIKYYGVGLFGKIEFSESLYVDAGIKAGKVKNDFTLDDGSANYNLDDLYYGAHLGGGYKIRLFEASLLELSAKYFYTHEDGDDITILGDRIVFDAIDSNRIKLGAKLSFDELASVFNPFVALNYEHEFGGASKASTEYYEIDTPTLNGGTVSGELGIEITPTKSFYIGLAFKGYSGQREGVNLKAEVEYKF